MGVHLHIDFDAGRLLEGSTLDALENGRAPELGFGKISRILASIGLTLKVTEANFGRPTLEDLIAESDEQP